MRKRRLGSIEFYETGNSNKTLLSVGKIHGDEEYSKYGILEALKEIENGFSSIKYIAIPEVNPTKNHNYNCVNINRDFGIFGENKTRELTEIVKTYNPKFIIDHHDNLETAFGFLVILPTTYTKNEYEIAKDLVKHICFNKNFINPCDDVLEVDNKYLRFLSVGVYSWDDNHSLIGYHKKGLVVEVDTKIVSKETAIEIHKECDLFLAKELEKLKIQ
jgi:hypothetical protein